jgi:pectinesterase
LNCYIEGTTDFIFGPSTAVFQNCTLQCKSNSFITAANTPEGKKFGFVFLDCKIIADSSVNKLYLGRPWRAFSKTVFIRCELPKQIAAAGWDNWSNPQNEKTVYYAEYKNTGEGANYTNRASWSKQLTDKEAKEYTVETIFAAANSAAAQGPDWFQQIRSKPFEWPGNQK